VAEHYAENGDCRIAYTIDGEPGAPALVLSNSIGTTRELWSRQVDAFTAMFRVIRYDARGHGGSSVPAGDYTMDQLGRDVLSILDAERIAAAHVCGLSLGGLTAMWLGVHAPGRVTGLVLANTAARVGSTESWTERIALVRGAGMAAVADRAMPIWFSKEFRERDPDTVHGYRAMLQSCSAEGYAGCCAALRDTDLRPDIAAIRCPTLVIAGRADVATPIESAELLRDSIPGARLITLDAAHLSNVEQATGFSEAVLAFLSNQQSV
jgi:3-oxoadipate enol-lactonase